MKKFRQKPLQANTYPFGTVSQLLSHFAQQSSIGISDIHIAQEIDKRDTALVKKCISQ
jgi:hypothetical protein